METFSFAIPTYVVLVAQKITNAGFKVYLVGGPVRDLLLGKVPHDFDLATSAKPEDMFKIFKNAKEVGVAYGTVLVPVFSKEGNKYINLEITTLRKEGVYLDARHPSKVEFITDIKDDVKRRDFTINAMAVPLHKIDFDKTGLNFQDDLENSGLPNVFALQNYNLPLIDEFNGMQDLKNKIVKAVGNPEDRFQEDALRMIRACRFCTQLGFTLDDNTSIAISQNAQKLGMVAPERIRDEFLKMLYNSNKPSVGIECLRKHGLLKVFLPELEATYGVEQPIGHIYDVYTHILRVIDSAPPRIRMAALLHDIAKPQTARPDGHFYGHDALGAKMAGKILKRLKFPKKEIHRIVTLVKEHMFFYLPDTWTDSAVRRFIRRVGLEYIDDLFALRVADATVNPKTEWEPKEIKQFREHIKKILEQENAFKISDLDINGKVLMQELNLKPGPVVGKILNYLLEQVLDNPDLNKREELLKLAKEYKPATK